MFCLVGYACGRARTAIRARQASHHGHLAVRDGAGVAAGEAGKAALGLMLSDPNVTGPAIRHVLPAAVVYDLLLCPFVLLARVAGGRRAAPRSSAPRPEFPGVLGAFRAASAGRRRPALRLAGSTPTPGPLPARARAKAAARGQRLFPAIRNERWHSPRRNAPHVAAAARP